MIESPMKHKDLLLPESFGKKQVFLIVLPLKFLAGISHETEIRRMEFGRNDGDLIAVGILDVIYILI